jgi:hypothetical protein
MRYPKANPLQKAIGHCESIEKRLVESNGPERKIRQIREAIRLLHSKNPADWALSEHYIKAAVSDKQVLS